MPRVMKGVWALGLADIAAFLFSLKTTLVSCQYALLLPSEKWQGILTRLQAVVSACDVRMFFLRAPL